MKTGSTPLKVMDVYQSLTDFSLQIHDLILISKMARS